MKRTDTTGLNPEMFLAHVKNSRAMKPEQKLWIAFQLTDDWRATNRSKRRIQLGKPMLLR